MRLLALGTGPFAVPALRKLVDCKQHEVLAVATRPSRSRRAPIAPMALAAEELGLPLWQPQTVNDPGSVEQLAGYGADLLVVCDYGEILKPAALAVTPHGGINLHGSLLPKYRGAAPVQWAVLNGDAETGNTVIQMTPGLDAGPCLGVQRTEIDPHETAGELEARLATKGADLVLQVIDQLALGTTEPVEQDNTQRSRAPRLSKEDGQINWDRSAQEIHNQVRALQPWPRAYTAWQHHDDKQTDNDKSNNEPLRIIVHRTQLAEGPANQPPGTILATDGTLTVATSEGILQILEVQPAGKRAMPTADFLNGTPLQVGDLLA